MKAPAPQRLPVMVGEWPNPVGFVDIGTVAAGGFKERRRPGDDKPLPTYGNAYVEIKVDVSYIDKVLLWAICGDPLCYLALQARRINPHWYLNGGDDD